MSSKTFINAVTDDVITRLTTNKVALGNWVTLYELDKEPSVIAGSIDGLPVIVVEPLADRPDSIRMTSGGGGEVYHRFSLNIMGYYGFSALSTDIRTLRGYAYDCFDLFRGGTSNANQQVGSAHVRSATVNPGYFVIVDHPIYKWTVTLNLEMIEL